MRNYFVYVGCMKNAGTTENTTANGKGKIMNIQTMNKDELAEVLVFETDAPESFLPIDQIEAMTEKQLRDAIQCWIEEGDECAGC